MQNKLTKVWFLNPLACMKELVAEGVSNFAFARPMINKQKIDPISIVRLHCIGTGLDPKIMLIGPDGCAEYNMYCRADQPLAVYPYWSLNTQDTNSLDELRYILWNPASPASPIEVNTGANTNNTDNNTNTINTGTPRALSPIHGQEHKVVINASVGTVGDESLSYRMIRAICLEAKQAMPNLRLYYTGSKIFENMFDEVWDEVDFFPIRSDGKLVLPTGFENIARNTFPVYREWVTFFGFSLDELGRSNQLGFSNSVRFNVRSVKFAAKFFRSRDRITVNRGLKPGDWNLSELEFKAPANRRIKFNNTRVIARKILSSPEDETNLGYDRMLCDKCAFKFACKLARSGSVCVLENSMTARLSRYFNTRNANDIIDGLGELLKMQADRLEYTLNEEAASGETNPDVTKQMKSVFTNGVQLAKLIDPKLNGAGANVQVNVNNVSAVASADPRQLIASAVAELERQGIPRHEITNDMIKGLLSGMAQPEHVPAAIEGQVILNESAD